MNEQGPLLICSRPFPPLLYGSAILSRNLWGAWPADDLVVLSQMNADESVDNKTILPNVKVTHITEGFARYPRLQALLSPFMAFAVYKALLTLTRQHKPRAIWANWPSTGFLLGAWWVSRKLRIPLYVHMHDMWEEGMTSRDQIFERLVARWYEKRILRGAKRVFAITDTAAAHFRAKHGIETFVLKHCIPDSDLDQVPSAGQHSIKKVIHFAGSIYALMNQDAVVDLVKALDLCRSGITLDGYTLNPAGYDAVGIGGPRVSLRRASKTDVMAAQRESAILFLPLAFQSSNPTEIRTVFPTKLLEYFVSGRPILVHAPADSWVSRAAQKDGWGVVVDTPDSTRLADTIDALLNDQEKQQSLVAAAFKEARSRLASKVAAGLQAELSRLETTGK
jgi:UDP-N-acetylglucosamine:LPS N-acetylglucosamine transferase